ncbi:hypothetical protein D3C78_1382470 [compost metagenome]
MQAIQKATKASVYPVAGQVLNVVHKSVTDKHGVSNVAKAAREVRSIKQVYITDNGLPTVKDNVGDVWRCKPGKLGEWDTCFENDK